MAGAGPAAPGRSLLVRDQRHQRPRHPRGAPPVRVEEPQPRPRPSRSPGRCRRGPRRPCGNRPGGCAATSPITPTSGPRTWGSPGDRPRGHRAPRGACRSGPRRSSSASSTRWPPDASAAPTWRCRGRPPRIPAGPCSCSPARALSGRGWPRSCWRTPPCSGRRIASLRRRAGAAHRLVASGRAAWRAGQPRR